MVPILIVLAAIAALTYGFWVLTKRYAQGDLSFWNLLAVVFVAKAAGKLAMKLTPGADWGTQLGIAAVCYILVLALGLSTLGKIRAVPAILLAIGFSIAATIVGVVLVMTVLPEKPRSKPAVTPPAAVESPAASGSASAPGK